MGNFYTCDLLPEPVASNPCEETTYIIPNTCSSAGGDTDDKHAQTWCSKSSTADEWGVWSEETGPDNPNPNPKEGCYFDISSAYRGVETRGLASSLGCCGDFGCAYSGGVKIGCKRKRYTGDPVTCCLQNYDTIKEPGLCYSDPERQNTCAPEYRSWTSTGCFTPLIDYCSGADLPIGDTSWFDRWMGEGAICLGALNANINTQTISSISQFAQPLIERVLSRYRAEGYHIGSLPGQKTYSPLQDYLYANVCGPTSGTGFLCVSGLNESCSIYNMEDMGTNFSAANWCGCYLPDEEYERYINLYQINKECTPPCARIGSIPLYESFTTTRRCTQNVCIIDNLTIELANSNIGSNSTNIQQICGGCNVDEGEVTSSCECFFEGDAISVVDSSIGGVLVSENCATSTCHIEEAGERVTVPCTGSINEAVTKQRQNRILIWLLVILGIIAIVIIFFLISGWFRGRSSKRASNGGRTG